MAESYRARRERVERLANEMAGLVGSGMSYQRARARLIRDNPSLGHPRSTMLAEAEPLVKARRRAAAADRRRTGGRTDRSYDEQSRLLEDLARQTELKPPDPFKWEPTKWIGVDPKRVDVTFINPQTGLEQREVVILPLISTMSDEWIASSVAAVISAKYQEVGSERKSLTYQAVWLAMQRAKMTITPA